MILTQTCNTFPKKTVMKREKYKISVEEVILGVPIKHLHTLIRPCHLLSLNDINLKND